MIAILTNHYTWYACSKLVCKRMLVQIQRPPPRWSSRHTAFLSHRRRLWQMGSRLVWNRCPPGHCPYDNSRACILSVSLMTYLPSATRREALRRGGGGRGSRKWEGTLPNGLPARRGVFMVSETVANFRATAVRIADSDSLWRTI